MHGLSVWKANSSELNLFPPLFWLAAGVNAMLRSFLYWDDSSKASPLLAIKPTNKRPCLHYSKPLLKQQSQTPITPLYCCCKSRRTIQRGTITQARTIIHIKHEPTEQWVRHSCEKVLFLLQIFILLCPLSLLSTFIFLLSYFWHTTRCARRNTASRHLVFLGRDETWSKSVRVSCLRRSKHQGYGWC